MHALPFELIRAVLESAPDATLIVDASGAIRFANQHVTELFGYTSEQLLGHPIEMLVPPRHRDVHREERAQYMVTGLPRPMGSGRLLHGLRADGSEVPVEISLGRVNCEPENLVVASIRDMTNHLRVERELQEARERADRANQAKSRFLATASHDLRQPLQSLSLLAGTLRRLTSGPAATEAVDSLEHAVRTMSRLLNALLDVSKLEAGKIRAEIRDFPLAVLLRELESEFAAAARAKGLGFAVEAPAESVHSDPLLVGQVLRNLLANAIRYTPAGSVALVARRAGETVCVEVRDTGIGIPQDQLAFIYDEFYQVHAARTGAREGYGLGLSIVQRLVALLHARLDVVSTVGKGTSFTLVLPRAGGAPQERAAAPARAATPGANAAAARRHVLLIEDDAAVLAATRMLLAAEGYRVTATASAEQALARVGAARDVDVVVADFHLGGGRTGVEAVRAVRTALGRETGAIIVTGDTSAAAGGSPQAEPGVRLLRKPVAAEDLLAALREITAD